jgi:hypothetical protein
MPRHRRSRPAGSLAPSRAVDAALRWLPLATAIGLVAFAFATWWFRDREPTLDDLGLFNPIYMYLKTGHMTYPVYDMYNAMVVHPPTHYLIVAWIMQLSGATAEVASLVPPLLWFTVGALALATSRLSAPAKFGLLFGALVGLLYWAPTQFIRPDLDYATAFLAGLFLLEASRNGGWDTFRLFLGSALLALASALHYPASASVFGVVAFAGLAVHSLGLRRSRRILATLALGAAVVLVPYFSLFVIPHWNAILSFIHETTGHASFLAGFSQTRSQYHSMYSQHYGGPFVSSLAAFVTRFGIPCVFVTTIGFGLRRETRGIALASAPQLLFLLFYDHTKHFSYYIVEFTLYFGLVGYLALLGVSKLVSRLRPLERLRPVAVTAVALALIALVIFRGEPAIAYTSPFTWHPLHEDMDIARAAGLAMLPKKALVGMNDVALWYITGASRAHSLLLDIGQESDLSGLNVKAYLGGFDAIAEESYDTWQMPNRQHEAIPSWFNDGLLGVRGFYFGDRRADPAPLVKYLLLSTRPHRLVGYALRGHTVFRFSERPRGSFVFVATSCPALSPVPNELSVPWRTTIGVPGSVYPPVASTSEIEAFVAPWQTYLGKIRSTLKSCRTLTMRRLAANTESATKFVERWRPSTTPRLIAFPQFVAASNALFSPPVPVVVVPHGTSTASLRAAGTGEIRASSDGTLVTTPPTRYAQAATAVIHPSRTTRRQWLKVTGKVVHGNPGICILDASTGSCLDQRTLDPAFGRVFYLAIPPTHDPLEFYVGNNGTGSAELLIRRLQVVGGVIAPLPEVQPSRSSRRRTRAPS